MDNIIWNKNQFGGCFVTSGISCFANSIRIAN